MIPDRASNAENWELDKLVTILLRQFKRLLADNDLKLTDADMQAIGGQVAARVPASERDPRIPQVITVLSQLVTESENVLQQWELTFAQSLETTMTDMQNWETTADFLEVANEKINAEVRISAGTSLMVALGDARYAHYLLQAMDYDLKSAGRLDVDAVIGKKALLHAAQLDDSQTDWLDKLRVWVAEQQAPNAT